jgi:hypothetical protein
MKLPNFVGKSHQPFASVFLAFSLFGFLFPDYATQVKQTHQVNLKASEQTQRTKNEKIKNPRVHPGQPYNQGWWPDP